MGLLLPPPPLYHPRQLAKQHGLEDPFEKFVLVCRPPENLRCLFLVCENLLDTFKALPSWQIKEPFENWVAVCNVLLANKYEISYEFRRLFGHQIDGPAAISQTKRAELKHPLWSQMHEAPLFAMLCVVHKTLPKKYSGLQLQILHAHWRKVRDYLNDHPGHVGDIREGARKDIDGSRHIKMSDTAARTVRALFHPRLEEWLSNLDTLCDPGQFLNELNDKRPPDPDLRILHDRITSYCETGYAPGSSGTGGARTRSIQNYLCVAYTDHRYGLSTQGQENDDGEDDTAQEHVIGRSPRGKTKHSLTKKEILDLGLDPLELADENPTVLTATSDATTRQEAVEIARARTRGFEIDRRLFPWNSQAMRLQEFHMHIRRHLRRISRNRGPSELNRFTAASAIAIMAETGRSIDEVLQLRIDPSLSSEFAYKPPDLAAGEKCGQWKWDAVSPLYKSGFQNRDNIAVNPEKLLIYPASEIVTKLIDRYLLLRPVIKSDGSLPFKKLFPFQAKKFRKVVRHWLSQCDRYNHFTPARISHLSWGILHELTGGELAIACLVLGLHQSLAQVELFYSILETTEAASLFAASQGRLWGKGTPVAITAISHPDPGEKRFVGCRAFPRIEKVKETIKWLREGSEQFFRLKLPTFNPTRDAELLNRAVMYAVWHQFFCFGTRAIRFAYQASDSFSISTGVGILSDKDFATGYKTRIILAPDRLRRHMKALESRLARLSEIFPDLKPPAESSDATSETSPAWLLDAKNQPVALTPTTIQEVMKEQFPLPVNSPRKVMRDLLRKAGMSHTHAEAFMGHWWHGREPFSPFSSFSFGSFLEELRKLMPNLLKKELGFDPVPGVR